jgi:hypothetical protein
VNTLTPGTAPAGVRRVAQESGIRSGRLCWVVPGSFELAVGDRVAVRDGAEEWLGEVTVPPERLVEWPELGALPVITRRVSAAEWPSATIGDGCRLLESLGLSPELLARRQPRSASGLASPELGASEAAKDE